MSFPVVHAVSHTVEESAHLLTDVVQGTRYAGKMYKSGMQGAYKSQLAESFDELNAVDKSKWSEAQIAQYDNA
jgi:hypothetical protein